VIDSIKHYSEKFFPLFIAIVLTLILLFFLDLRINNIPKFDLILGGTVTISSIVIAFLGTMVSILITLINTKVMKRINNHNAGPTLTTYISRTIYSGLVVAVYSLLLYPFIGLESDAISKLLFLLFVFFTSYFLLSSLRINLITLSILKAVFSDKNEEAIEVSAPELDSNVWPNEVE
jgi:hypothetical protein